MFFAEQLNSEIYSFILDGLQVFLEGHYIEQKWLGIVHDYLSESFIESH